MDNDNHGDNRVKGQKLARGDRGDNMSFNAQVMLEERTSYVNSLTNILLALEADERVQTSACSKEKAPVHVERDITILSNKRALENSIMNKGCHGQAHKFWELHAQPLRTIKFLGI